MFSVKSSDDIKWREAVRQQMEAELDQRVRDALETPPPERHQRQQSADACKKKNSCRDLENLNAHVLLDLTDKERAYLKSRRWKALQAKRQMQKFMSMNYGQNSQSSAIEVVFRDELSKSNQDEFPGVYGLNSFSEGVKDLSDIHRKQFDKYPTIRQLHKQYYTKEGFLSASRHGKFPDGTPLDTNSDGSYEDKFGVIRNHFGPFWPGDWGPLYPAPKFIWNTNSPVEPLYYFFKNQNYATVESQLTPYVSKWRGVLIVFDSERSSRDHFPSPVPQGCCPSLQFESRFECGNLRQARRVGQFEYELVLKTDLYTNRHTQWYYFRVQNAVPGVTYKLRIVNLLKRDSLYNYGMRPLMYSEADAKSKGVGWTRVGHHISYSRNVMHLHCPLLMRGFAFYELEWQMEFPNDKDTYYLAHCFPYTFTDLKDDLEALLNDPERQAFVQREVLCETRAGNSCFLVTITNFDQPEEEQEQKKAVVITARVHPGESQASWMMKGVLDYVSGPSPEAQLLRNRFVFKIVPMLNPDGVIVGNYRCSLAARDLNRNYRHPRKESFPTVWHTKNMIETISEKQEVLLYCDLHGHSRKHNVFMYGNNTSTDDPDSFNNNNGAVNARAFLNERLFPWLMAQKSPEKFSFPFCKFNIKRCKEATGRVVMWRQMKIHNSFTLEATFSGTAMNKDLAAEECRHFNISDFMQMGESLCQSVLEYSEIQENKARQTEIVLEMTRYLTCQVLERRNRGTVNYKMPNLRAFMARTERENRTDENDQKPSSNPAQDSLSRSQSEDIEQTYNNTSDAQSSLPDEQPVRRQSKRASENLSKGQVDSLLDAESMKTMDGCLAILAQLNMTEVLQESDSSDSDSESEPELKPPDEPKIKKKKRKSKKQRDKEQLDRKNGSSSSNNNKKEDRKQSALPTISGNAGSDSRHDNTSAPKSQGGKSKKVGDADRRDAGGASGGPHFVSKYEGRKNGGIPCYAEERSVERAAKQRMAEMKKRTEEEKQRELAFFQSDDEEEYLLVQDFCRASRAVVSVQSCCTPQPLEPVDLPKSCSPSIRNELPSRPLPKSYAESMKMPTIVETLARLKPRAYHSVTLGNAYSFRDLAPSVVPANGAQPNSIRGPSLRTVNRHMTNSAAPSVHYNGPGSLIRGDLRDPGRGEEKRRHAGPLYTVAKQTVNVESFFESSPKDPLW